MLLVGENGVEVAEMERARSALLPKVHSKFEGADVFWVKVHHFKLVHFFPGWFPAKTKGIRTSLRLSAIGKHALRLRKWRKSSRNGASAKCTISPSS